MIGAGDNYVIFKNEVTTLLGFWMVTNLTFKEPHNSSIKKAQTAKVKLQMHTMTYEVISDCIRAVQIMSIQVVALYQCDLWSDQQEVGR